MSGAKTDRFEFGPDVVTLERCTDPEAGLYNSRSAARVLVNGIHRGYLYHPRGYGGRWTVTSLSHLGGLHRRRVEAAETGVAGQRQVLGRMLESLHERFPVAIEAQMRARAAANHKAEREYLPGGDWGAERRRESEDRNIAEGWARIRRREAAEEHAAVLATIPATGLSNRQAAALDDARRAAARDVAAIYGEADWSRQRRAMAEKRQVIQSGRGVRAADTPDWWPLD